MHVHNHFFGGWGAGAILLGRSDPVSWILWVIPVSEALLSASP